MHDVTKPARPTCVLQAYLHEAHEGMPAVVYVTAQLWQQNVHVKTVKLLDMVRIDWPADVEITTVEAFANTAAAIVRRLLGDEYYNRLKLGTLTYLEDKPGRGSRDVRSQ